MELRAYNIDLELQGICDNFVSVYWTRNFLEADTFKIVIPATQKNIKLFSDENIIEFVKPSSNNKKVCYYAGFPTEIYIEGVEMTIIGKSFDGMLENRILMNYSAETVIGILDQNAGETAEEGRRFQNTVFNKDIDISKYTIEDMTDKPISEYIKKVGKVFNFGLVSSLVHEEKPYIEIRGKKTIDRTINQSERVPVIFSDKRENANNFSYNRNNTNAKNAFVMRSEYRFNESKRTEVDEYNTYRCKDESQGYFRREGFATFMPKGKLEYRTITVGESSTTERWLVLDAEATEAHSFDVAETLYTDPTNNVNCDLILPKNYDTMLEVGDMVTVYYSRMNITVSQVVNSISELYNSSTATVTAIVGTPPKNLKELLN